MMSSLWFLWMKSLRGCLHDIFRQKLETFYAFWGLKCMFMKTGFKVQVFENAAIHVNFSGYSRNPCSLNRERDAAWAFTCVVCVYCRHAQYVSILKASVNKHTTMAEYMVLLLLLKGLLMLLQLSVDLLHQYYDQQQRRIVYIIQGCCRIFKLKVTNLRLLKLRLRLNLLFIFYLSILFFKCKI